MSYVLPVPLGPNTPTAPVDRSSLSTGAAACTAPNGPRRSKVSAAVEAIVDERMLSAKCTYGSVLAVHRYHYTITRAPVS